jgi:hypothetical protein
MENDQASEILIIFSPCPLESQWQIKIITISSANKIKIISTSPKEE